MKPDERLTLREILESPEFAPIAKYAIFNYDVPNQPFYPKTLRQLRGEHFGGNIIRGLERLDRAIGTGDYLYPVYTEEECALDPAKRDVNLTWFPSDDPEADARPYIFLVPGGGFMNVWNLTEGWPIADHFNRRGCHVFVLTYRVGGTRGLIPQNMEDFAHAFRFIRDNAEKFHVHWDRYITCGFSAGGYLICLWATRQFGCHAYGLPAPEAMIPVYPFTSWKVPLQPGNFDPDIQVLGCTRAEAEASAFEIPEHTEGFPPCAVFVAAGDSVVPPENSYRLCRSLEAAGIPCRLEVGPEGNHGFADGESMCMEGWPERAVGWIGENAGTREPD